MSCAVSSARSKYTDQGLWKVTSTSVRRKKPRSANHETQVAVPLVLMCVGSSKSAGLDEKRMRSVAAHMLSMASCASEGDMCSRTSEQTMTSYLSSNGL